MRRWWPPANARTLSIARIDAPALRRPLRPPHSTPPPPTIDPYTLLAPELARLRHTLLRLLGSSHPTLTQISQYYFRHPSKQLRPLLVLLFAHATNGLGAAWPVRAHAGVGKTEDALDVPLSRADVLTDWNPSMPEHTAAFDTAFVLRVPPPPAPPPACVVPEPYVPTLAGHILPTQSRLAQIVEMIHVASLLHDDVLDVSSLRRGAPSAPARFGNKRAVLAGDFLLGRASAALSRLGDNEVVELIASAIANLVEGEIMQIQEGDGEREEGRGPEEEWRVYMRKTYLKTGSLIAKGARAAVVLGGAREGELWKEIAYAYGRNIGLAFQLVDDVLDYEAGEGTLGKPGGADLSLGLATAPALYAWEEHDAMGPLIHRKFAHSGDVDMARSLVRRSQGVERTRDLARTHAIKAREALAGLPDSDAKVALEILTERVVQRTS